MIKDTYKTITNTSEGLFTDKGSKFIAYAFPIKSEDDIKEYLEFVKKEHWKARHHCYAWRLGTDRNTYRSNDDGEPSGTAGKPILGQLDSFEITDTLVIVVRYFGGTKLGVGGLINAYKSATIDALNQTEIEERTIDNYYKIVYDYGITSQVMNFINHHQLNIINQSFGEKAMMHFSIPISKADGILEILEEKSLNEGFADLFELELTVTK
jgi:uncharacterized YigZ family protein